MLGILSKILFDLIHNWSAYLETPWFESCGYGIVAKGALYSCYDVLGKDQYNLLDLGIVICELYSFVYKADAQLIQHQLGEPGKHLVNDMCEELSSHYTDDCEKDIVSFVMESQALHTVADRVINDHLFRILANYLN